MQLRCFFFFFQAEDGIRDSSVTAVQTCALPISASQRGQVGMAKVPDERLDWLSDHFHPKKTTPATLEILDTPGLLLTETERRDNPRRLGILRRSEERRVGKEGRSRWSPYH